MRLPLILATTLTAMLPALSIVESMPRSSIPEPDGDIAGVYECEGTRPDGAYQGTVEIVRNNGTYELLWSFGSREQYLGFGIVSENILAVSIFGGAPGVVAYRIEHADKGLRLIGQWSVPGANGQVFNETLTKVQGGATESRPIEPPRGRVLPMRSVRSA